MMEFIYDYRLEIAGLLILFIGICLSFFIYKPIIRANDDFINYKKETDED